MKSLFPTLAVAVSSIVILSASCFGQYASASENAYLSWRDRQNLLKGSVPYDHLGIGLAASKYQEIGIAVDISVFTGSGVSELTQLEFAVQPLHLMMDANGKVTAENIGGVATLKSGRMKILSQTESRAVIKPEIIVRAPKEATAVRISLRGFGLADQEFSVVLPVGQKPHTAVLATSLRCNSSNLSECQ